jgi:hypothetical protein
MPSTPQTMSPRVSDDINAVGEGGLFRISPLDPGVLVAFQWATAIYVYRPPFGTNEVRMRRE